MSEHVYWMLEVELGAGQDAAFSDLMAEMVRVTQANEPGTLNYEWHRGADGKAVHIYERYANSDAVLTHLGSFGANFAQRFLAIMKPTRFTVYGAPNAAVREALAGFGPVFMNTVGGFGR